MLPALTRSVPSSHTPAPTRLSMLSTLHFPAITRSFSHRIIYGYGLTSLKGSRTTASEIVLMDAYSRYFTYNADAVFADPANNSDRYS